MIIYLAFAIGVLATLGVGYVAFYAIRAYLRFSGTRLVTCPETNQAAAVQMDARHAAAESFLNRPHFRLSDCSRWPQRLGCGQECLREIELAPADCLVRNIVGKWFTGKRCVYCLKRFETVESVFHHNPALLGPDRKTLQWDEIRPEKLPAILATALPVCWNCHLAEKFRRERRDFVVDNPWQNRQGEWIHRENGHSTTETKTM